MYFPTNKSLALFFLLFFVCHQAHSTGEFDVGSNQNILKVHLWNKLPDNFQSRANLGSGRHVAFELDHEHFYAKSKIKEVKEEFVKPCSWITDAKLEEYWGTKEVGCVKKRTFHFPFMSFCKEAQKLVPLARSTCQVLGQPSQTLCLFLEGGTEGIKTLYQIFLMSLNPQATPYSEIGAYFDHFVEQSKTKTQLTKIFPGGNQRAGFYDSYVSDFRKLLQNGGEQVVQPKQSPGADEGQKKKDEEAAEIAQKKLEEERQKREAVEKRGEEISAGLEKLFDEYTPYEKRFFFKDNGWSTQMTLLGTSGVIFSYLLLGKNKDQLRDFRSWRHFIPELLATTILVPTYFSLHNSIDRYSDRREKFVDELKIGFEQKTTVQVLKEAKENLISKGFNSEYGGKNFQSFLTQNCLTSCLFCTSYLFKTYFIFAYLPEQNSTLYDSAHAFHGWLKTVFTEN